MLYSADGERCGSIGGGHIERQALVEAENTLKANKGKTITVSTDVGEVDIVIDLPSKGLKLHVIGGGHVGLEVARTLSRLGYVIYIYDIYPVNVDFDAFVRIAPTWEQVLDASLIDFASAIVITLRDKKEIEPFALTTSAFYIGYLTSRERAVKAPMRVYAPIGLDIGAETPEEIALSVAAEIVAAANKKSGKPSSATLRKTILVRGAGDIATGAILALHNAGYNVIATEIEKPTVIRSTVAFSQAMFDNETEVERVKAKKIKDVCDRFVCFDEGVVPIIADPELGCLEEVRPAVVIDAILAKRNLGTRKDMASLVIALGPGFTAGVDVDLVIETMRGHELGRIIEEGKAIANTGTPGLIAGYGKERVVKSSRAGLFKAIKHIGDVVKAGDVIALVDGEEQKATISGMVRGMLHSGLEVTEGFKIADIDPRGETVDYLHISDKARAIGGSVLQAVDRFFFQTHLA